MSDTKHVVVTREGLQRMKEELEYKETTEKMKVAEQLKVAISYGDLSENAEYDAAKNDQAVLEQRIAELKAMIENAVVVDESKIGRLRHPRDHRLRGRPRRGGDLHHRRHVRIRSDQRQALQRVPGRPRADRKTRW